MNFPTNTQKKLSAIEFETLQFWKDNDVFQKSIDQRPADNEYVFYDGPPFATGTPHYGHILAGAIKDAIPRYFTMKGFRVNRKFGWDCHGVPVEFLIEKEHKIGGKPGIEKMGVAKFNDLCEGAVMRCADEWESTVERMGRAVDFVDDYKTMDADYMECVWSVFRELWNKGLIYEGEKVVPYSPKLGSPLSNFEANQNYQDIDDPAVTVEFKVQGTDDEYFLAWTTTPWTLPSNVAVGFGKDTEYSLVDTGEKKYWVATEAIERNFGEEVVVVNTRIGKDFFEMEYEPIFPFFKDENEKRFIALHDEGDYITTGAGTGIVHFAPSFGEEDAMLCQKFKVFGVNPIDENGYFDESISELFGKYFRADKEVEGSIEDNANIWVLDQLKNNGKLFKREQIRHDYPFCWRTDCALMYRGIKTWFVDIQKIKKTMVEKNQNINWSPDHLKDGRFGKMLESAPDWAISRNRYWGAPLPVWRCQNEECGHIEVVSTRKELEEKTGEKVTDIHKQFVDQLTWDCEKCSAKMERIEEVLDCWFESGSMPYASRGVHFQDELRGEDNIQTETITIKKIMADDEEFPTFLEMLQQLFDEKENGYGDIIVDPKHPDLFDTKKDLYIIQQNNITVGIVRYDRNENDKRILRTLYIIPEKRNQDIGTQVVKQIEAMTRDENIESLVLNSRSSSEEFYKKLGFQKDFWIGDQKYSVPYGKKIDSSNALETQINNETQIYIVRHGESEKNTPIEIESCSLDSAGKYPLTKKGKQDAENEAKKYKNSFDVIITSPFLRAKQTAEIFQKYNPNSIIIEDINLKDINVGEFDEKTLLESNKYRNEVMNNDIHAPFGGGESLLEVQERMFDVYLDIKERHKGRRVLIVSHGCPLEALYDELCTLPLKYWDKCMEHTKVFNTDYLIKKGTGVIYTEDEYNVLIQNSKFKTQNSPQPRQADFIAEGLDQTRGWFYTLHVLGCALTGENIFKNVITNGIVLAEDGQKMSKSKKNYPDPNIIFDKYGADAMRFYMLASPVVRAENFRFGEKGVEEVLKKVLLPMHNVYSFFSVYANIDNYKPQQDVNLNPKTDLDKWILSEYETLRSEFTTKFEEYKLDEALRGVPEFMDALTNWFVRRSRDRFWQNGMSEEKQSGYETLYFVLTNLCKLLAPIMPFYTEHLWKNLTDGIKTPVTDVFIEKITTEEERTSCHSILKTEIYGEEFDSSFFDGANPDLEKSESFVVKKEGSIIGCFQIWEFELQKFALLNVALLKDFQNKDIGTYIISLVEDIVSKKGGNVIYTNADKEVSNGFYKKLGFVEKPWNDPYKDNESIALQKVIVQEVNSVHLQNLATAVPQFINEKLSSEIGLLRNIISLSSSIRARQKIKNRQPLAKLSFAVSGSQKLSDESLNILKEETNVKEIVLLENLEGLAKQIVKPNARVIGKRFGKQTQDIIKAGKSGNFELLSDGTVKIGEEVLDMKNDEFEFGFETAEGIEGDGNAEAVVLLDTEITKELMLEGLSRELIRNIQELRKSSDFNISDRISVKWFTESDTLKKTYKIFGEEIDGATLTTSRDGVGSNTLLNNFTEMEIDGDKIWIEVAVV